LTERLLAFNIGWVSQLCAPTRSGLLMNSACARSEWDSIFSPASLENQSISLAVTRLTERPLAFKIGWVSQLCVPARSELLRNSRRARSEWESVFSPASLENQSVSIAVTRLTERPLAFKIGLVSQLCVPTRSELLGKFAPRAFGMGVSFQSCITRESIDFPGGAAVDRAPAGFQNWLGQPVVCSHAIGVAWEIRPARVQNGTQFSVQHHSRINRFPWR
jgi:hypothetical protein